MKKVLTLIVMAVAFVMPSQAQVSFGVQAGLNLTNISDFSCGYYDSTDSIDYLRVGQYSVNISTESPLEFLDDVEIQEIKFIKNYKYAYYKIYNPTKGKTYYGIIDIKQNLVVFNTEEELLNFVPYTEISMLAITANASYEVCIIKEDNKCIQLTRIGW